MKERSKADQDWLDSHTYEQKLEMLSFDQCIELFNQHYAWHLARNEKFKKKLLRVRLVTNIILGCIILVGVLVMALVLYCLPSILRS